MLFKEFCRIRRGASPRPIEEHISNVGIPWIKISDVSNGGKYINETKEFIKESSKKHSVEVQKGDLIVTNSGSPGIPKISNIYGCIHDGWLILDNFKTFVSKEYIYYWLMVNKNNLVKKGNGSIFINLKKEILENFEIDLPDRKTQDKIVEILSNIDNQIEQNNSMVKRLQDLGNTIYSNNALLQKETFNIVDIANPIWGVCPSGEHILETKTEGSIKYASGAGDIDDNLISINPKGYTDLPSKKVNKKDICISVAGTVGKVGIANEEIAIGRAMLGFSNKELYGYLYFGLSFYSRTLQKKSTGAIQKIINASHIEIINLPKYNNDITNQLNNIVDMILDIETQTNKLDKLKQQLLPLLINGQIII